MPGTIGLIAAIPQELQHLREALAHDRVSEVGGFRFDHGTLDGRDVVVAEAGIGKVNTAVVATLLATRFDVGILVFSGVAGGLDPELKIGDLVIADRELQHDAGTIEHERIKTYQAGHVPFFNPTDRLGWNIDPDLLGRVQEKLADLRLPPLSAEAGGEGRAPVIAIGPILTGDQFLNCEVTRERLHQEFQGRAVAMEGAAMAQVAARMGIPWLEIRALSDLAGQHSLIDFRAFVDQVAESSFTVLRRLVPVL